LPHIPMPDITTSSPLTAALDPRVDEQAVQEQMQENSAPQVASTEAAAEPVERL
jgi:hypothetical protein